MIVRPSWVTGSGGVHPQITSSAFTPLLFSSARVSIAMSAPFSFQLTPIKSIRHGPGLRHPSTESRSGRLFEVGAPRNDMHPRRIGTVIPNGRFSRPLRRIED